MSAPQPIAQGDLRRKPLAHVVLTIFERGLSGTLAVWPDEPERAGQDGVYFHHGKVAAARFLEANDDLMRGLLPLFHRKTAAFAFFEANLVGTGEGTTQGGVHPYALIMAASRGGARREAVDKVLKRMGEGSYRLAPGVDLGAFKFIKKEKAIVDFVQSAPRTLTEWVELSGNPRAAKRTLYALSITKSLAPVEAMSLPSLDGSEPALPLPPMSMSEGPMPAPSELDEMEMPSLSDMPPPPPPATSGPAPAPAGGSASLAPPPGPPPAPVGLEASLMERWNDIRVRFAAIDSENYYQMLGVETNATNDDVEDAYVDLIKRYHPDRLPAELSSLRGFVDTIFHHLTEAKNTLTDGEKRQPYFKIVQDGGGSPEADRKLAAILDAAMAYQKVEVLVRRKEWGEAIAILDQNLEISPDEPDYPAMKAWILLQRDGDKAAKEIRELAEGALEKHEKHERALVTLGYLHKRLDEMPKAVEYFRRVVDANPKHMDAARELRLAEMRGQTSTKSEKPKGEGFLSKLFGSSKK